MTDYDDDDSAAPLTVDAILNEPEPRRGGGKYAKLPNPKDSFSGVVSRKPEAKWAEFQGELKKRNGKKMPALVISLENDNPVEEDGSDEEIQFTFDGNALDALKRAWRESGSRELTKGDWLKLTFDSWGKMKNGTRFKDHVAEYRQGALKPEDDLTEAILGHPAVDTVKPAVADPGITTTVTKAAEPAPAGVELTNEQLEALFNARFGGGVPA